MNAHHSPDSSASPASPEPVEQPGRSERRTGLGDAGREQPVCGDHGDLLPGFRGLVRLPDDLGVTVLRSVDDGHVAVAPGTYAGLRPALEDQHDLGDVGIEVGGDELFVEATRGTGAVLPPAV